MSGRLIDFRGETEIDARAALEAVLGWTEPARSALGLEVDLPERNGAERSREALAGGAAIEDIYREAVAETARTYTGATQAA
jgi:carboxylate-amine ligase